MNAIDLYPMERYKYKGSSGIGLLSNGGEVRNFWISSKAAWQSSLHLNFLKFFKARNRGKHFLAEHEMNRPSAVILPLSFWSSFRVLGAFIFRMASIFSGFALCLCVRSWIPGIFLSLLRIHTCPDWAWSFICLMCRVFARGPWHVALLLGF